MAEEPKRPIQVKAKGKKLTTKRRKLLDNIPAEFRAQATEVVTKQAVPTETQPDATFAAQQVGSSVEMDNTTESQKIDEFLDTPMPVTLTETVVTGKNQLGTRTRTLDATIQTAVPGATVEEDVVHNIGAGRSVRERTVVPEVFSEDRYEVQKPDLVPEKFRGIIPQSTESHVSEGTAAMPTLGPTDLAKSSEQLKEDVVRNTTTGRSAAALPVTLEGEQVNEVQQLENVNQTLDDAPQTLTLNALTQPGSKVEELGAGLTLKTEVTVAAVFERERFAKERPDVTPEVFKATIPQESTSVDSAGTAVMPTLGTGEISRSSEQVTDFIKRDSLTNRPAPTLPAAVTDSVITPEGQVGTRVRTLDNGIQTVTPSATLKEGRVEALGDGRSEKTTVTVPSVFERERFAKERPDVTPEVFRATIPQETTSVDSAGNAAMPTLGVGEISRTSEQVTDFVKRDALVSRPAPSLPAAVTDSVMTPEGQVGTRVRTLDTGVQTISPSATTKEARVETLGDGRSEKTVITVPTVFGKAAFTKERPDVTPAVFKATIPQDTTRLNSAGTAAAPTLAAGDVSKTSEQVTEFEKRDTTVTRAGATLPASVTDSVMTPQGQVGTRVRTLDTGVQTITPSATTKEAQVEVLGDGTSERTVITVPSVFNEAVFSQQRPDVTPAVFKATIPEESTKLDSAGTAAMPTLGTGEISKTSRQKTAFVKEDTTVTRAGVTLPQSVTDTVMTPEGQIGTRVRTLDAGLQTFTPTATTKEARVEVLGDGTSEKSVISVPTVFGNLLFSADRPEVIPVAFRSAVPTETTRLDEPGTASMPTLGVTEVSKTMEQMTAFVRRVTTKTRATPGSFPTLTLRSWDSDLRNEIHTVMNVVPMFGAYSPASNVIDYDEKELDDNYSLRVEYKLPGGMPASYDTRVPGQRRFPGVLTNLVVTKIQLADTAGGDPRWEVAWFPEWRPGFTMDVNYIVTTSFSSSEPAPDAIYVIKPNDIVIKGISFQVSIPDVLNNALNDIGVTFTGDGVYGNLSELYDIPASVPTASSYSTDIGSIQVVASKVEPWRRLWVKRTTKVVLL